jgi:hypothetical protein
MAPTEDVPEWTAKVIISVNVNGRIAIESQGAATNKKSLRLILVESIKLVDQMQT